MAEYAEFCRLATEFASVADFVTVYIAEAHPANGWFIRHNDVTIDNHVTIDDRLAAARRLLPVTVDYVTVLCDVMSNDTGRAYAGRPERLYIIYQSTVVFQSGRGPEGYILQDVCHWLNRSEFKTRVSKSN
jgi:hypothetical protein